MKPTRSLSLKKETLSELSGEQLATVAAGDGGNANYVTRTSPCQPSEIVISLCICPTRTCSAEAC